MSLPEQVLFGVYLGVVTGILPGIVAWSLGFVFKYFTTVTIPALGVMVVSVGLAGVQGGLLGLLDVQGVTAIVALLVVMMVSIYSHSRGDKMGAEFPHRISLRSLKDRTLPADVVEKVGKFGRVRIRVVGDVVEMEGYAPMPEEMKRGIREREWSFPADISVSELEKQMTEALVEEFELSDASVSIDGGGRATVVAAPPLGGLSKRVPKGKRAVSFNTLVPTGLARGDEVTVEVDGSTVDATVVSARSGGSEAEEGAEEKSSQTVAATDGGAEAGTAKKALSTAGGEGRVTVAVGTAGANKILGGDPSRMVVNSRGTRREYGLVSVLKSAGKEFREVRVGSVGDYEALGVPDIRENFGVIVLAVQRGGTRIIAPRDETVQEGDELFVVGSEEGLDSFEEALR